MCCYVKKKLVRLGLFNVVGAPAIDRVVDHLDHDCAIGNDVAARLSEATDAVLDFSNDAAEEVPDDGLRLDRVVDLLLSNAARGAVARVLLLLR